MKATNLLLVALSSLSFHAEAQFFNKELIKAVKASYGEDYKKYKFSSYPLTSFGVGTVYKAGRDEKFLCETWGDCYGLKPMPDPLTPEWLSVKGFAESGGGAPLKLDQTVTNKWGGDAAVPELFKLFNLDFSANKDKVKKVEVRLGDGYVRHIKRDSIQHYFVKKSTGLVKQNFNDGRLAVVTSDLIVNGIDINITLDRELSAEFDVKVGLASDGSMMSKLITNANSSFNVERKGDGNYVIKFDKPLILARYIERQRDGGFYSANGEPEVYNLSIDESSRW